MSGHYFRTPAGFIQVSGDKLQGLFKEFQEPDFVLFKDLTKKPKKSTFARTKRQCTTAEAERARHGQQR